MKTEPLRPVAALILDGPLAPETARRAADLARKESRPLVLLVPVERTGFSINSVTHRLAAIRQSAEAETIAARVRPALDSTGTEAEVRAVPCLSRRRGTSGDAMLKSITAAARRLHASVLVLPTGNDAEVTTHETPHRQPIEPSAAKAVGGKARNVSKEHP